MLSKAKFMQDSKDEDLHCLLRRKDVGLNLQW